MVDLIRRRMFKAAPIACAALLLPKVASPLSLVVKQIYRDDETPYSNIKVTTGGGQEWRTVYAVNVLNVQAGDVLEIQSEGQITNDLGYNVEIVSGLFAYYQEFAPSWSFPSYEGYISPLNGENATPAGHHYKWSSNRVYVVPQSAPNVWICARARARSTAASGSVSVKIDQLNYGQLQVIHFGAPD